MSETEDPLVEALRRKVKYQKEQIEELEETVDRQQTAIEDLESDILTLHDMITEGRE